MQKSQLLIVLVVGLILGAGTFVLIGGNPDAPPPEQSGDPAPPPEPTEEGGPQRVIVLSPALAEMVYAMGEGDRVVGVSDFCEYPPEIKSVTTCGGLITPSYEVMESLDPDLVIVQGLADSIVEYCDSAGIPVLDVPLDSLDDIYAAIEILGEELGATESADGLIESMRSDMDDVREAVAGEGRPPVFLATGRSPGRLKDMMTAGGGSFLSDLVGVAGGENVFADSEQLWPQPAVEAIVAAEPEVIIDIQPNLDVGEVELDAVAEQWSELRTVPAVREGRVHVTTEDALLIPGPRVTGTARVFARLIHPEVSFDDSP
ncbi:MAG: ABC transporter substrate-binding protein [Armatimonadia bacterium]|nr:ABC transporter substrate-binding protein [Armatimonadia bacterium]